MAPQHKVRITKPFCLGVYEVTQAEYEKLMGGNPSHFSKGGSGAEEVSGEDTSRHPVENVRWEDAVEFCKRLSAKEGKAYRLPTEAEWEYACRAGATTLYSFGDDPTSLAEYAWHSGNSDDKPHSVGQKKPNAWGFHDMHGNVWEWCVDWYGLYGSEEVSDPWGPETGTTRVIRGGCRGCAAESCRAAFRFGSEPWNGNDDLGFRVAADPSGK
jgi:formylglycine-generating enzyme required for sulfatase activity